VKMPQSHLHDGGLGLPHWVMGWTPPDGICVAR
jgi:hypothetical protein